MTTTTYAQEAVPAAGGNAIGQGGTASFSVGQVTYTVISGQGYSAIQGVQQPFEISVISSSEDFTLSGIDIKAYPNPTTNYLILTIESELDQDIQSLTYELIDMNGRILEKKSIFSNHTNIQMDMLAPATYILKVYDTSVISFRRSSSRPSKTFKILKK